MLTVEALSELLHALHSAPLDQRQWQRFLTLLSRLTASNSGYFLSADPQNGLAILAEGGRSIGELTVTAYNQAYATKDPFRAALFGLARASDPIGVFTDEDLLPSAGLLRTELYRDLLAPARLRHGTFTILGLSLARFDAISIWRTEDEGPLSADSLNLLKLLVPHIQTALEVRRLLGATQRRLDSVEVLANANSLASFVLDQHGAIKNCNTAAEALVRNGDGLRVANGRLLACDPECRSTFCEFVFEMSSALHPLSGGKVSGFFPLKRGRNKRPLQAVAQPLPDTGTGLGRDILLVITDPEGPGSFPEDALRALYGLTPTETEVAKGLMLGYSAEEIACVRRVSVTTVRQQIKNMLSKTRTNRQTEMVRLLMTLPQIQVTAP